MIRPAPCKDCKSRSRACHDHCAAYKTWAGEQYRLMMLCSKGKEILCFRTPGKSAAFRRKWQDTKGRRRTDK